MKALLAGLLLGAALAGAQTPRTATAILDEAKAQAAPNKRAIFTIFHASW
jgi:hypothetical protein